MIICAFIILNVHDNIFTVQIIKAHIELFIDNYDRFPTTRLGIEAGISNSVDNMQINFEC